MSASLLYVIAGRTLESNVPLPELPASAAGDPVIRFTLLGGTASIPRSAAWFQIVGSESDDSAHLRIAEGDSEYLLQFPKFATFTLSRDGSCIRCYPLRNVPAETLRHLLLDQVVPLALTLDETHAIIHGGAVVIDGKAVGIMGFSGAGKSTLTVSFAAHGYQLLSDDCLVLRRAAGGWSALPHYSGVRLWPDNADRLFDRAIAATAVAHYSSKLRVGGFAPSGPSREFALEQLLFLGEPASGRRISISPLSQRDAFSNLVEASFALDVRHAKELRRQFEQLTAIVSQVPCCTIRYPREHAALGDVRAAIVDHVRSSCRQVSAC